ncbi:hypothetical protein HYFRA_00000448 [Hymenoscyphus fraxineus]|uniref:endo-polygalacturonase n=1 Tax=Hymenoscyphus fraxineus TaxID=746836 RepID=A0A9N9PWS1_9HELO|nr:hypothetical protein HYFRA_00000448 [Hymenoscyphus fraxineus]
MVQFLKALGLVLSSLALVTAVPTPTAAPDVRNAAGLQNTSCTFTDAAAAIQNKKSCATIVLNNIAVPSGTTLDLTKLTTGTHVIFEGKTTFGYEEWSGPLVSVSGQDIVVTGASGNCLDGDGKRWWDKEGTNGGKTKPKFFYAHSLTGASSITGLNVLNSPVQVFSVNGAKGLTISDVTIDNSAGDEGELGHNTDAFDVGSSDSITISGAYVKNQDDCLAINSGTNIIFTNGSCSGGHGLSIGSVGGRKDNTVDNITISSSTISNSDNGVRIKTVSGATGAVKGVTYKDIKLNNIAKYGIVIQQDYENGSPTGIPTTGVPITDLTISNVFGTVASGGTDVYILCGSGSCSNWTWSGISITGGQKSSVCTNIPSGATC